MLNSAISAYEDFLGVDPKGAIKNLVRTRAIIWFGWALVLIQAVNLVGMSPSYGHWTSYHTISVSAIVFLLVAIHSLRYYKNFTVYAAFFATAIIVGVGESALPAHTGVNSSLIPLLVVAPLVAGFTAGPRAALGTGFVMLGFLGVLYFSSGSQNGAEAAGYLPENAQRVLEAGFAIILVTVASTAFSGSIFRAFDLLESNVKRARAAEAAKERFLTVMSHELRTPLNSSLGLSELMRKTSLDERQTQLMDEIEGSGRSILAVVNDLLDMPNAAARQAESEPAAFDLRKLVSDIANVWRSQAAEKGLKIMSHVNAETPAEIIADEARLRDIITKIVSNAVKYTTGGSVSISAKTTSTDDGGATLIVAVKDTGPGVEGGVSEAIFEGSEQANAVSARSEDGARPSLAACRDLARRLGGDIHFNTKAGAGSTFYLTMPVKTGARAATRATVEAETLTTNEAVEGAVEIANDAPATVQDEEADSKPRVSGWRVLIVEDNRVNRVVAEQLLRSMGVQTESAEHGAECLDIMKKHEFDVILMDKHMPIMDGVEATEAIRSMDGPAKGTPIVACTADVTSGCREALLEAGFNEYLSKPVSSEDLETALTLVLPSSALEGRVAAA